MPEPVRCQSCDRETKAAELLAVQRAYFFDAEDDDPEIIEEVEQWCASCRSTYPHVEVESE